LRLGFAALLVGSALLSASEAWEQHRHRAEPAISQVHRPHNNPD
jgi:hypothetical protein